MFVAVEPAGRHVHPDHQVEFHRSYTECIWSRFTVCVYEGRLQCV